MHQFYGYGDAYDSYYPTRYLLFRQRRVYANTSLGQKWMEQTDNAYNPLTGEFTQTVTRFDGYGMEEEPPLSSGYPANPYIQEAIDSTHWFLGSGYTNADNYDYENRYYLNPHTIEDMALDAVDMFDLFTPGEVGNRQAGQVTRKPYIYTLMHDTDYNFQITHETSWPFPSVTWPAWGAGVGDVFKSVGAVDLPFPPKNPSDPLTNGVPWIEAAQCIHHPLSTSWGTVVLVTMMSWIHLDAGLWTRRTVRQNRSTGALNVTDYEFRVTSAGGQQVQTSAPAYDRSDDIWIQLIKVGLQGAGDDPMEGSGGDPMEGAGT